MASDRARKLLNLALVNQRELPTVPNNVFDARSLPFIEEDSRCINKSNDVSYVLDLPSEAALIVPLEDIENYSLVENGEVEIFEASDFYATGIHTPVSNYVPTEQNNIISDAKILEPNIDAFDPDSAMTDNYSSDFQENAHIIETFDVPAFSGLDIPTSDYTLIDQDTNRVSDVNNMQKDNSDIENCDIVSNVSEEFSHPSLVPYSSSSGDDTDTSLPNKSKKRKRRLQVRKTDWFAEKNKRLREKGSRYYGKIKKDSKWVYEAVKEPKSLQDRCKCATKTGVIKCATVTNEERRKIFNQFWKTYTWGEKKVFVNDTIQSVQIKRQRDRKESDKSRRTQSFVYNLKIDDKYVRVCKTMYLNTIGIGRMTVLAWKEKMKNKDCIPNQLRISKERVDPFLDRQKSMNDFFDSLPVLESHYCRASSTRKYLQPEWNTKMDLYKFYTSNWCKSHNVEPLSKTTFFEAMSLRNLSLYRPKKDECELCTGYKTGTKEESIYQLHILKKEEARQEKDKDKRENRYVFTVDLQAVLMAPKSNVSTLYYKTKLQVHNLCFYDNINKDGYCFVWNETEGGLNADEFASIWTYFIENKVLSMVENKTDVRVTIYSDGCGYQNRNVTMSNALLNIAVKNNIIIEQKYLEVGHTQMEVDAMHSLIERKMRHKVINVPADYVQVFQTACNKPFDVMYLEHNFFKNFSSLSCYKSIRPGRTTGDSKVTDIRALMYSPSGCISYKLRFGDPWTLLPQRKSVVQAQLFEEMTSLHKERIKIKARKYNDLQQIKEVLPVDFRPFYDNLPHN